MPTFLEIDGSLPADARELPLARRRVRLTIPEPLIYVIGHPDGRDLEFSLHDNKLVACNERLMHYRTPTEGGHSGSPVFEENGWEVVALHHAGGLLEPLDGKQPPYQANEGIAIGAISQATRSHTRMSRHNQIATYIPKGSLEAAGERELAPAAPTRVRRRQRSSPTSCARCRFSKRRRAGRA